MRLPGPHGGVSSSATTAIHAGVASERSGSHQGSTVRGEAFHRRASPLCGRRRAERRSSLRLGRELRRHAPTQHRRRSPCDVGKPRGAGARKPPPRSANRRRAGRPTRQLLEGPEAGGHDPTPRVETLRVASLAGARQSIAAPSTLVPHDRCGTSARARRRVRRSRSPQHSRRPTRHQTPWRDPGRPPTCCTPGSRYAYQSLTLTACPSRSLCFRS